MNVTWREISGSVSKFLLIATAFVLPLSVSLTNIFFILVPVLSFISGDFRGKIRIIFNNPVALLMLAFFALFIFSLSYTVAPLHEALRTLVRYDKIFFAVLLFPLFTQDKLRRYSLNAFILGSLLLLFFSYLKHLGFAIGAHDESLRGHINFGFNMALIAYFLALKFFDTRNKHNKVILLFLLALTIFNFFFLSIGRSGYFIFAALLVLLFFQKLKWRGIIAAIVVAFILFGAAYSFSNVFKLRINTIISDVMVYHQNQETSVGDRITFWRNSVELIKQKPIFGYGVGGYRTAYSNIKPTPAVPSDNCHNEYLYTGVQFGLIGVFMLLFMFGFQLWKTKVLPLNYCYIAQAVIMAIMLGSFANSWLLDAAEGHVYAYFMALSFAALKIKKKKQENYAL